MVGLRAKFFHPMTFGVMHWGTVQRMSSDGKQVLVYFEVDERAHWTESGHYRLPS